MAIPEKLDKAKNVLLLGTGPSVLYNIDKVREHIEKFDPVIISINGYIHGLREMTGKSHKIVFPDGTKKLIDMKNTKMMIPDIHFSFLKYKEKTNPETAIRGEKKRHNLFKYFIERHRNYILKRNISLMYPNKTSREVGTKFGSPSWEENCYPFRFYPKKCTKRKHKNNFPLGDDQLDSMFEGEHICFRAQHGGEYVLARIFSLKPNTFAICGFLDYPLRDITTMRRGWFWVDSERNMPPKMSRNQSRIVAHIKKKYGKKFADLNLTPWK